MALVTSMELENGTLETKDHEHRTERTYLSHDDYELIQKTVLQI